MILQNILKVVYLFQTREMNKKYKKNTFLKNIFWNYKKIIFFEIANVKRGVK